MQLLMVIRPRRCLDREMFKLGFIRSCICCAPLRFLNGNQQSGTVDGGGPNKQGSSWWGFSVSMLKPNMSEFKTLASILFRYSLKLPTCSYLCGQNHDFCWFFHCFWNFSNFHVVGKLWFVLLGSPFNRGYGYKRLEPWKVYGKSSHPPMWMCLKRGPIPLKCSFKETKWWSSIEFLGIVV